MTTFRRIFEQEQQTFCPRHGFGVPVDVEGNCLVCGNLATGRPVDQLYANRFTIDLNVLCAGCGDEIEFSESSSCTGCGAVLCDQCLHIDPEGEQFCDTCWDGLLADGENDEVKEAIDDEFSTSNEKEEAADDTQPE